LLIAANFAFKSNGKFIQNRGESKARVAAPKKSNSNLLNWKKSPFTNTGIGGWQRGELACHVKKDVSPSPCAAVLANLFGLGFTAKAKEKWEQNQTRPTEPCRSRIAELLGFAPDSDNSTSVYTFGS